MQITPQTSLLSLGVAGGGLKARTSFDSVSRIQIPAPWQKGGVQAGAPRTEPNAHRKTLDLLDSKVKVSQSQLAELEKSYGEAPFELPRPIKGQLDSENPETEASESYSNLSVRQLMAWAGASVSPVEGTPPPANWSPTEWSSKIATLPTAVQASVTTAINAVVPVAAAALTTPLASIFANQIDATKAPTLASLNFLKIVDLKDVGVSGYTAVSINPGLFNGKPAVDGNGGIDLGQYTKRVDTPILTDPGDTMSIPEGESSTATPLVSIAGSETKAVSLLGGMKSVTPVADAALKTVVQSTCPSKATTETDPTKSVVDTTVSIASSLQMASTLPVATAGVKTPLAGDIKVAVEKTEAIGKTETVSLTDLVKGSTKDMKVDFVTAGTVWQDTTQTLNSAFAAAVSEVSDKSANLLKGMKPEVKIEIADSITATVPLQTEAPVKSIPTVTKAEAVQIIDRAASVMNDLVAAKRPGTMTVRLNPEELGSLTVTIKSFGAKVDADVTASHASVRQALEHYRTDLVQNIEGRGLSLGSFNVGQESSQQFNQNQPGNGSMKQEFERISNLAQNATARTETPRSFTRTTQSAGVNYLA